MSAIDPEVLAEAFLPGDVIRAVYDLFDDCEQVVMIAGELARVLEVTCDGNRRRLLVARQWSPNTRIYLHWPPDLIERVKRDLKWKPTYWEDENYGAIV